jgi:DUF35 OB-fold domain, acyl-CoA-associated
MVGMNLVGEVVRQLRGEAANQVADDKVPYALVTVDLVEGVRMLEPLVATFDELRVGLAVSVNFEKRLPEPRRPRAGLHHHAVDAGAERQADRRGTERRGAQPREQVRAPTEHRPELPVHPPHMTAVVKLTWLFGSWLPVQ